MTVDELIEIVNEQRGKYIYLIESKSIYRVITSKKNDEILEYYNVAAENIPASYVQSLNKYGATTVGNTSKGWNIYIIDMERKDLIFSYNDYQHIYNLLLERIRSKKLDILL